MICIIYKAFNRQIANLRKIQHAYTHTYATICPNQHIHHFSSTALQLKTHRLWRKIKFMANLAVGIIKLYAGNLTI